MHRNLDFIERSDAQCDVVEYSRRALWNPSAGWYYELRWQYSDGSQCSLQGDAFYGGVIPARPGFEMIFIAYDESADDPVVVRQDVIAWRHDPISTRYSNAVTELEPLVQSPVPAKTLFSCGVLQPDGR